MEKLVTYKKYIFENAPLNVDDESDQFEVANCNVISVQTICNTVSGTVAIDIQASNVGGSAPENWYTVETFSPGAGDSSRIYGPTSCGFIYVRAKITQTGGDGSCNVIVVGKA